MSVNTSAGDEMGLESENPGRDVQRVGTARFLGEDVARIHDPVWGVVGTLGDSQCYLGVRAKVDAVQAALAARIRSDDLPVRLIAPAFTLGVSDGQLNGTERMRYSLIGRELVNDSTEMHLRASEAAGIIAVVACDKPPVGTLAAVLEHNAPAVLLSDGSIKPGIDPATHARIDLVAAFQCAAESDPTSRTRMALNACPGQGSCGGMFTYNTMQTFIGVLGMEPLHMIAPTSDDPRRMTTFPDELVDCLATLTARNIRPRDIVTPAALRNAITAVMAMGGSTNVALHGVEIARAAGVDLWNDVLTEQEFNHLSRRLPLLVDLRPFGAYSMVDIDAVGGVQVIVAQLLDAGLLDGTTITCTGETLAEQTRRLDPPPADGRVIHPIDQPFKPTGGLRLLHGNLAPDGGAVLKVAGVEGGIVNGRFTGRARVFNGERSLVTALTERPDSFADNDMVVIRYEGPRGAPGMPELLDPTSRITALCRQRQITIALMTDTRFSGGSVGLVIGHVAPEAFLGGPIALIEEDDTIVVDLNTDRLDCVELDDPHTFDERSRRWRAAMEANDGVPPDAVAVTTRVLGRMRATAEPALRGGGMAVPREDTTDRRSEADRAGRAAGNAASPSAIPSGGHTRLGWRPFVSDSPLFKDAFPYQEDVLALPVVDLDAAAGWYSNAFGLREVERRDQPHQAVILERDGVRIGFALTGGDASQDGAAIQVSDIHRAKEQIQAAGLDVGNERIEEQDGEKRFVFFVVAPDGLCFYFYQPISE